MDQHYLGAGPDRNDGLRACRGRPAGPGRECLVGKAADMVVLDRNLQARDAGPIGDARVALTFADGTEVYSG